jgi:positive regulator of sigma E activity
VFLLPCLGLGLGYALGLYVLRLGELASMLTALLGLAAGFVPAFLMNRSITQSAAPEFAILKQLR